MGEQRQVRQDHADVLTIGDLETLKVVADPLRLEILEELRAQPRTVKEVAADLGIAPTRLYYHFKLLEEHGLIRVTDTRVVSGIIEKHYQTTAQRLTVDRSLLSPGQPWHDEGLEVLLSVILDEARGEIRRSVRAGLIDLSEERPIAQGLLLGRRWLRLLPDRLDEFQERLKDLVREFEATENDADDAQIYEFLIGLYPTVGRPQFGVPAAAEGNIAWPAPSDSSRDDPAGMQE